MQLVGHARERGREILAGTNLGVAAAGFFRDAGKTRIGKIGCQHRLQPTRPDPGRVGRAPRLRMPIAYTITSSSRARSMTST